MDYLPPRREREIIDQLARFTLAHKHGHVVLTSDALHGVTSALDSESDSTQRSLGLPCSDEVTANDAHAALLLIPRERRYLDLKEQELIEAAMDRGSTWEELGKLYQGRNGEGISRQAMQQRYRRLGGTRTWPTRKPADNQPAE